MLRLLGGLTVDGVAFRQPKPLLLLAYVATEGPQPRRHLAELLWPGEAKGLRSLTAALVRLRHALPGALDTDDTHVRAPLRSDVQHLLEALDADDASAVVERYRGPFLAGFHLPGWSVELEEWVHATREYLASRVQEAQLALAEEAAAAGRFVEAAHRAELAYDLPGALGPHPEALERFHRLLVAGDSLRSASVREEAAEFGVVLAVSRDQARVELTPADRAVAPGPLARSRYALPSATTPFVGRDAELVELGDLLADGVTRLLTITGPGGTGKTRLAIQAAHAEARAGHRRDGTAFVSLERLADPARVPRAIADAVGLELHGDDGALPTLTDHLGRREILVVLDNFEHLLPDTAVVSHLLRSCPGLTLMVTSRERLAVDGEQLFPLVGLPLPAGVHGVGEAGHHDALRLFVQCARRARRDVALDADGLPHVLAICQLLQGSPLGIELAAALVRLMPIDEIADEIARSVDVLADPSRGTPERHRSLRATFDYSWKLLSRTEQAALRRLAVFVGGFTRQAAAAVGGASITLLGSLVDKSLLRTLPGGRFDRHPLLYEFTVEKLAEAPREAAGVARSHALHFLAFAESAEPHVQGPGQTRWLRRLEAEHDNLAAALRWMAREGETAMGLRLSAALRWYWHVGRHANEGRAWLETFLSASDGSVAGADRALALSAAGELASKQGDVAAGQRLLEEALERTRALGDVRGTARNVGGLGNVALFRGDYDAAWTLHDEGLRLRRTLDHEAGVAGALHNLAITAEYRGDLAKARALHLESLELSRARGDDFAVAGSLLSLGHTTMKMEDVAGAAAHYEQSLRLGRTIGDSTNTAYALNALGLIAWDAGDHQSARDLLAECLDLAREIGDRRCTAGAVNNLGMVALSQAEHVAAAAWFAESLRMRRDMGDAWGMAYGLIGFAALACATTPGDPARAARLTGAAVAALASLGSDLEPPFRRVLDATAATTRSRMGDAAFDAEHGAGAALGVERATAFALE